MSKLNKTDHGTMSWTEKGSDKVLFVAKTLQCKHCGKHWIPQPGSGRVRGWCMNCHGPICGPGCATCVPEEALLENYEKGRPLDFRSIQVYVPADVP